MAEIVRVCDVSVCDRCNDSVDKANLKLAQQATSYLEWLNYSQDALLETLKLFKEGKYFTVYNYQRIKCMYLCICTYIYTYIKMCH